MVENAVEVSLTSASSQPTHADVVILGGGAIGVSIAWNLARKGVQNIVVLERGEFGSGSSAKPLGGVRANFSDPANITLGQRSLEIFRNFKKDFGIDIGLRKVGYLFLARTEEEASGLSFATSVQNELGINSRNITAEEALELNPYLDPEVLVAGAFSPDDGYAQPARVVEGYVKAAQALGVTFLNHTEALEAELGPNGVESIRTNRGTIRTESAICATGAWSQGVGEMFGVDLPVEPVRRLIAFTPQREKPHPTVPFTLDLGTTFYYHNCNNGLLLGISHKQEPGFCREFSYDWTNELNAAAGIIAPSLQNTEIVGGWAGLYENTPDHNAIIGRSEEVSNLFYATGFSGHGFLQSPAVGELVADMYLGQESFMDPTPFSVNRFSEADLTATRELHII